MWITRPCFLLNSGLMNIFDQRDSMVSSNLMCMQLAKRASVNSSPLNAAYICESELANFGSGNDLSPIRHQAIAWTNVDLLSIGLLGTNFIEIRIEIQNFSFMQVHLKTICKMSAILSWGDELTHWDQETHIYIYIYASLNGVIAVSGNDSLPARHQTVTWTNTGLLSI